MWRSFEESEKPDNEEANITLHVAGPAAFSFPAWFRDLLDAQEPKIDERQAGLDHQGHYKNVALAEPYFAEGKALLPLLAMCEKHYLIVDICAVTSYWPSKTLQIAIYRAQEQEQYSAYLKTERESKIKIPKKLKGET